MKKIVSLILCVLLAAGAAAALTACDSDTPAETTAPAVLTSAEDEPTSADATEAPITEEATEAPTEEPTTEEATEAPTEATTAEATAAPTTTKKAAPSTTKKAAPKTTKKAAPKTTNKATTTKKATTAPAVKVPSSKAEIVDTYNKAINKVISSKAGYTKSRTTHLNALDGASAIMKIKVAADAVNSFLGVGTTNFTNPKGSAKFLSNSALTASEVTSAKIEKVSGDVYKITLSLANGKSSAPSVSDSSPLRHCGLYVGSGDKTEFDYKNANNIYVGINNAEDASVQSVSEETLSATITAQVDLKTGKLVNATYKWNWNAALTKVKYTIVSVSGTGRADSTVTVKDIKW